MTSRCWIPPTVGANRDRTRYGCKRACESAAKPREHLAGRLGLLALRPSEANIVRVLMARLCLHDGECGRWAEMLTADQVCPPADGPA